MRTLALLLLLCAPLAAQTTLTVQTATNLPDATGGAAGEGFTCTGITRHSNGTDWWVMGFGQATPSTPSGSIHSVIVHLNNTFTTNLGEIDLAAFTSSSMQGLCRVSDNSLWIVAGPQLRHYSEAGTLQTGTVNAINVVGGCNGLTYDSGADLFYIVQAGGGFIRYAATAISCTADSTTDKITATSHGLSNGQQISFASVTMPTGLGTSGTVYFVRDSTTNDFKVEATIGGGAIDLTTNGSTVVYRTLASLSNCTATAPDHLCMVGTKVWCCAGVNNSNGTIWEYDPANDAGGWTQLYTISGANAPEGIAVEGSTIYVMNDGYYHSFDAGVSPAKNRALIFSTALSTDRAYALRKVRRQ